MTTSSHIVILRRAGVLACALLLGACATQDTPATLMAENITMATEAANIRATLAARSAEVYGTATFIETEAAAINSINAQLVQTARVVVPPTQQIVAQIARGAATNPDDMPGEASAGLPAASAPGGSYGNAQLSTRLRDSDGCPENPQTSFPTGTSRVYAVTQASNVPANTRIDIEWTFNGAVALSDTLRVLQNEPNICLWFYVEPYSQGSWAVQFYSNGTPVGGRLAFIVGS